MSACTNLLLDVMGQSPPFRREPFHGAVMGLFSKVFDFFFKDISDESNPSDELEMWKHSPPRGWTPSSLSLISDEDPNCRKWDGNNTLGGSRR